MKYEDIKPYPRNAKKHDTKQIALLAENIKRFGFDQHIVVDKKTGYIVKGHGRWLASELLGLKKVKETVPQAFIISKIESVEGVKNFEAILEASDGVMVARGDLAEAENLEKVPCLQKSFTKKTLKAGKYLIAATEMMLSMTQNPTPTRAEVSDVANAVFDGASAVMLSEETAIGKYPVETVEFMRKIIKEAEDCNEN